MDSGEGKRVTIQTHDGRFHADDVGAVALLTNYYKRKSIEPIVIRSRETSLLESSDIVLDVGLIYDPKTHRYDHHQDCNETFNPSSKIPLSSIGMVWKHFGKEILEMYVENHNTLKEFPNWTDYIDDLHEEVYFKLISEIDGNDNGVPIVKGGQRNYHSNMNLPAIISALNTKDPNNQELQLEAFYKAVDIFCNVFDIKLSETISEYFDFRENCERVRELINSSMPYPDVYPVYLNTGDKIKGIYKCLDELDPDRNIKFIIYKKTEDCFRIRTRNQKDNFFVPIVPLISEEEATELLGESKDSLIFIHKNLFAGATKTLESATKIVTESLWQGRIDKYPAIGLSNLPDLSYDSAGESESFEHSSEAEYHLCPIKSRWTRWILLGAGITGIVAIGGLIGSRKGDFD